MDEKIIIICGFYSYEFCVEVHDLMEFFSWMFIGRFGDYWIELDKF